MMDPSIGLDSSQRSAVLLGDVRFDPERMSADERLIAVCRAVDTLKMAAPYLTGAFNGDVKRHLRLLHGDVSPQQLFTARNWGPIKTKRMLRMATLHSDIPPTGIPPVLRVLVLTLNGLWGVVHFTGFTNQPDRVMRVWYEELAIRGLAQLLGADASLVLLVLRALEQYLDESEKQHEEHVRYTRDARIAFKVATAHIAVTPTRS